MSDFDRIFEPQYTATELFTNRVGEHAAFVRSLQQHLDRVRGGTATLHHAARRNVLSFYGIGGIGKTQLSQRLASWTAGKLSTPGDWPERQPLEQPVRTVRVDFHGSRVVNAADIVLRLRAAVAGRRRHFPAFDLGLAAWWSLARPGVALPDLNAGGLDVRGQLIDTVNDALGDAGAGLGFGGLTVRTGIRIAEAVRENRLRDRTLQECTPLRHIVEQTRQDPSEYVTATLAGLLTWDLENLPPGKRPVTVAFADAGEYVQGGDRTQERLVNRIVHLTPGMLWVFTSRNRLDWDGPHLGDVLPAAGPHTWPGLRLDAIDEPRQHLVGSLSDTDVEQYLHTASGTAGTPELPPDVIESIRNGAHGLPLYLSLSLSVARSLAGSPLTAGTFGRPLPELATRVFANLPDPERELARAAALVPRFDEGLIAQAAGGLAGDAHRLCRRTLVTRDEHPVFPYRLHDAVRSAIAHEPVDNAGAWAPADRAATARRLLDALRDRSDVLLHDSEQRLHVLESAAALCAHHDLEAPWLADALFDVPGFAQTAERLPPPTSHNWAGHLSGIFEAWRHGRRRRDRIAYLEEFLSSSVPADIATRGRLRLAYLYRDGDYDTALRILQELLEENPTSQLLRYQVARTLRGQGAYEDLEHHLRDHPIEDPSAALRVRSDLAYDRGMLDEAVAGALSRARILRAQGRHRIALENEATVLWRKTLSGRSTPGDCDAVLADADRFGEALLMRTALACKAISLSEDGPAVRELVTEAQGLIDAKGYRTGWREWMSRLVIALRRGEPAATEELYETWSSRERGRGSEYRVLDRLFVFAGYPPCFPPVRFTAAEEPSVADERWRAVFEALVHS